MRHTRFKNFRTLPKRPILKYIFLKIIIEHSRFKKKSNTLVIKPEKNDKWFKNLKINPGLNIRALSIKNLEKTAKSLKIDHDLKNSSTHDIKF